MKILSTLALLLSVHVICEAKPNVIVIFADDLGYADLGCQAKEPDVRTPHLDRFAKEGVRFTSGYVTAPQCSPSRAGLMTGRHQQRFGFDTIPDGPLPLTEVTMAEMLKPTGYVTGQVGKWHLEPNHLCVAWAKKTAPASNSNPRAGSPCRRRIASPICPATRDSTSISPAK